ncbi:glutamine synthetase family protein [soil metagenome]
MSVQQTDSTSSNFNSGTEPSSIPDVLRLLKEHDIRFLNFQFVDILGVTKSVEVPASQFDKSLDRGVTFDGSGIEGFTRVEESDLLLRPDPSTFRVLPWEQAGQRSGRMICDVQRANGSDFEGDPRAALRRSIEKLSEHGYTAQIGAEVEFYLTDPRNGHDRNSSSAKRAGYFDPLPEDREEVARREMVVMLEALGFEVESSHHDRGAGQHGIDFRHSDPLKAADNLTTLKSVVRVVARRHGLEASFMPKPLTSQPGCGLHTHHSLWHEGRNVFHDPERRDGLSDLLRSYVAGVLRSARGMCAVTNPLVNSYKRLVPGSSAPVHTAWSLQNRSALVRIPPARDGGTRCEIRMPDPAANPYLAFSVQIAAGLAGIAEELVPPESVNTNVWTMSSRERQRLGIEELPRNLGEALDTLARDRLIRGALGEHIFSHFTNSKRAEFESYLAHVHPWELERYADQ